MCCVFEITICDFKRCVAQRKTEARRPRLRFACDAPGCTTPQYFCQGPQVTPLLGYGNAAENPPCGECTESKNRQHRGTDQDHSRLAKLYGVTPSALIQAVRRNRNRFPTDFLFQLTNQEVTNLKSQSVISSLPKGHGGRRHRNWAFTEQGVAMLSSVLRSNTAVRVNIEIMRAFVRLRRAAIVSSQVMALVEDLSKRVDVHDAVITDIVESIRRMVETPGAGRGRPIGFTADIEGESE